jgi:hypothetical protein
MKKYLLVILAIGLVLALSGCDELAEWLATAAFEPYAYVEDAEGNGIAGADVTLKDADDGTTVFTGATGSSGYIGFGIAESWNGDYILTVEMEGYDTVSITVTIAKTAQFLGKIILRSTLSITGKVIDAKIDTDVDSDGDGTLDDNAIEGVTVTLLDADGTQVGDATESAEDGTFTFNDVDSGVYTIHAEKSIPEPTPDPAPPRYAFIDEMVEVLDTDLDMGVILGFASPDDYTVSIIVTWSAEYDDVDAYLTYPNAYKPNGDPASPPSLSECYLTGVTGVNDGFEANVNTGREIIYYSNKTSVNTLETLEWGEGLTDRAVELDVDDVDGSGPESISIRAIPFDYSTALGGIDDKEYDFYTTEGLLFNALDTTKVYGWLGVMEYYINGNNADFDDTTSNNNLMNEGEAGGADVTVYVAQGTQIKGRYIIPDYTKVAGSAVIRINLLVQMNAGDLAAPTEVFQILPDIRVFQNLGSPGSTGPIKGIGDSNSLLLKGRTIAQ